MGIADELEGEQVAGMAMNDPSDRNALAIEVHGVRVLTFDLGPKPGPRYQKAKVTKLRSPGIWPENLVEDSAPDGEPNPAGPKRATDNPDC